MKQKNKKEYTPIDFKDDVFRLKSNDDTELKLQGLYNKKEKCYNEIKIESGSTEYLIKTEELRTILFLLSDDENKKKLMNKNSSGAVEFDYPVEIRATKDIKKDDIISLNLKLQVGDFKLKAVVEALVSLHGKEEAIDIISNIK